MSNDVTIVTAFVDIGRDKWSGEKNGHTIPPYIKRDVKTYLDRFERLTKLKNRIIVFAESKFNDAIKSMRDDIVIVNIDTLFSDHEHLIQTIEDVQTNESFINFTVFPASPEYWSPEYVAINLMKSHFVSYAIEQGLVSTPNTAWIDFGYCRENTVCPEGTTWKYDTNDKINLFCQNPFTFTTPIFEIVRTGQVFIQGCHIVAPNAMWSTLKQLINDNLSTLLNVGLIDDDQTLLLMAYRSAPELFDLVPANSENWFTIFEGRCE